MAQEEREHNRSREKKVSKGLKMHDLSGEQQMVPCCWSRRYVGGGTLETRNRGPWFFRGSTHPALLRFWGRGWWGFSDNSLRVRS